MITFSPTDLSLYDFDGRDAAWRTVLSTVAGGAVELGRVVAAVERAVDDAQAPRISGWLQEMARGGHIRLHHDGRRWLVAPGPKGGATLARLVAGGVPRRLVG